MFEYLAGKLVGNQPPYIVLDVGGVGYRIQVPMRLFGALPALGSPLQLFVSYVVRETSHQLFGFETVEARDLFDQLTHVSGIGPKSAIGLLGYLSVTELCDAIAEQDVRTICKAPGVGKKTAERLVIDLKDKLPAAPASAPSHQRDALHALINLGYSPLVAKKALQKVVDEQPQLTDLAPLITAALSRC